MKSYLALAVVSLLVVSALAHDSKENGGSRNRCVCSIVSRGVTTSRCTGNTGTRNIACTNNAISYLQCVDAACTNLTCGTNEIFNRTTLACQACPTGTHVDALNRGCVCDQGTTRNRTTGACVQCPSAATVTPDKCYCDKTLYAFDRTSYACKACPPEAILRKGECKCNDSVKIFWSESTFSCLACPDTLTSVTVGRGREQKTVAVCQCTGANQIFDDDSVTCVTCPTDSIAVVRGNDGKCRCTTAGQVYNRRTNTCVAAGTIPKGDLFRSSEEFY